MDTNKFTLPIFCRTAAQMQQETDNPIEEPDTLLPIRYFDIFGNGLAA